MAVKPVIYKLDLTGVTFVKKAHDGILIQMLIENTPDYIKTQNIKTAK